MDQLVTSSGTDALRETPDHSFRNGRVSFDGGVERLAIQAQHPRTLATGEQGCGARRRLQHRHFADDRAGVFDADYRTITTGALHHVDYAAQYHEDFIARIALDAQRLARFVACLGTGPGELC